MSGDISKAMNREIMATGLVIPGRIIQSIINRLINYSGFQHTILEAKIKPIAYQLDYAVNRKQ